MLLQCTIEQLLNNMKDGIIISLAKFLFKSNEQTAKFKVKLLFSKSSKEKRSSGKLFATLRDKQHGFAQQEFLDIFKSTSNIKLGEIFKLIQANEPKLFAEYKAHVVALKEFEKAQKQQQFAISQAIDVTAAACKSADPIIAAAMAMSSGACLSNQLQMSKPKKVKTHLTQAEMAKGKKDGEKWIEKQLNYIRTLEWHNSLRFEESAALAQFGKAKDWIILDFETTDYTALVQVLHKLSQFVENQPFAWKVGVVIESKNTKKQYKETFVAKDIADLKYEAMNLDFNRYLLSHSRNIGILNKENIKKIKLMQSYKPYFSLRDIDIILGLTGGNSSFFSSISYGKEKLQPKVSALINLMDLYTRYKSIKLLLNNHQEFKLVKDIPNIKDAVAFLVKTPSKNNVGNITNEHQFSDEFEKDWDVIRAMSLNELKLQAELIREQLFCIELLDSPTKFNIG